MLSRHVNGTKKKKKYLDVFIGHNELKFFFVIRLHNNYMCLYICTYACLLVAVQIDINCEIAIEKISNKNSINNSFSRDNSECSHNVHSSMYNCMYEYVHAKLNAFYTFYLDCQNITICIINRHQFSL